MRILRKDLIALQLEKPVSEFRSVYLRCISLQRRCPVINLIYLNNSVSKSVWSRDSFNYEEQKMSCTFETNLVRIEYTYIYKQCSKMKPTNFFSIFGRSFCTKNIKWTMGLLVFVFKIRIKIPISIIVQLEDHLSEV